MKKIIGVLLIALVVLASVPLSQAQQTGKVYRIGIYRSGDPSPPSRNYRAFLKELRDIGYIEGQNLKIVWWYKTHTFKKKKDRLDHVAHRMKELVQQKVDVIFTVNPVDIRAAKKATKTIPIVMLSSIDPVAAGLVDSLAHPGGNITGTSTSRAL